MVVQIGAGKLKIQEKLNIEICRLLKSVWFESGGIIGIDKNGLICEFQYDNPISYNCFEYRPNTEFLNKIINYDWSEKEISFAGFVHSHPHNSIISDADIKYAQKIMKANEMKNILMGILDLSINETSIIWYNISNEKYQTY